jgi:nucleoid DNA-binding protein
MTKQQLIEAVANASQRSKTDVAAVLESSLDEITQALRSGDRVDLRGFGNFRVKQKKARQGRNPRTGEPVLIAARKAATFKPSKELAAILDTAAEVPSASS